MSKIFPESIRKIGLFPLSLGVQGPHFFETALRRIEAMGVNCKVSLPEGGEYRYLAGSDEARAESFNRLLADESIDLLFAIRGGFGAVRTLPFIDWDLLMKRNIPVVGFSDMTGFLLPAWKKGFKKAILGKMAEATFGDNLSPEELDCCARTLYRCVAGKVVSLAEEKPLCAIKTGRVTAPIVPCNLMLLISLIGTPWMPDLSGTILVIESVGQGMIQIERNLTQLEQSGILESLAGLVFGNFTGCDFREYQADVIWDYAQKVPGPVCSDLKFGHEEPGAVFRVGGIATLEVNNDGSVVLV